MNRALPEMLHCLNTPGNLAGNCTEMSVLERQRVRMKWQHEQLQQQQRYVLDGNEFAAFSVSAQAQQFQGSVSSDTEFDFVTRAVKADTGFESGWLDFGQLGGNLGSGVFGVGSGFEMNYGIPGTTSCPPAPVPVAETKKRDSVLPEKMNSAVGSEGFKKRKANNNQNLKAVAEEDSKEKRIKGCAEDGESKITDQGSDNDSKKTINYSTKRTTSADTSKENSKVTEVQKPDYIHVRARRGQATDSHSLAERVRREKISERMKYLQDLVPGCNKITGKAGMLDEIINYVQSLQRQVEFLSMKLATVNPAIDFNIDNFLAKEVLQPCTSNFQIGGVSSEITNPAYLEFNTLQQILSCSGLEMGINNASHDHMALRRTISAPVSIRETFLDHSSCFNIQPSSALDANLQNLYSMEFHQGRSTSFPTDELSGPSEASNLLKTEI